MSTSQTPDRDISSDPDGLRDRIAELEREHDERRRAERAFQSLVAGTSAKVGEAFFPALARHLAVALDVRHVFVTALTSDGSQRLRTLACWSDDHLDDNFDYETSDTPCAHVIQEGDFHCAEHLQEHFPRDATLVELEAESFVGVRLAGSDGRPIGHLCVLDDKPMPDAQSAIAIMRLFATRATVELERLRADDERRARERQYRERDAVLVQLARSQANYGGDLEAALREITRAAAHTLAVDRVSAWVYNDDHSKIRCLDLYELDHDRHSSGIELTAAEFPSYFLALDEDRIIAADDARHDPRTKEFKHKYLEPLAIVSMLDAPIRVDGRSIGVICHEQVGVARHWSSEDCAFAAAIADSIALSHEAHERREVQRALESQRVFLRQVLDITPNLIFVKDRQGRFTLVNQSVADTFGTTIEAVIGKTDADFDTNANEVAYFRKIDLQVMDSQQEHFIPEERITDASNRPHWLQTVKRPIVGEDGVANHVLGVATDISARKRAEAALRESEERNRILVEHAPEAIVVFDTDLQLFVDANRHAERLFKLTREHLLAVGPSEMSPLRQPNGMSSSDMAPGVIKTALDGGTPLFEWVHRDSEGREFPCEVRLVRLPSSERNLVRGSIIDITERKRAEERQTLLMRELDHRVKNNLATVLAIAEQTAAGSSSLEEFQTSFSGRIRSMSIAHELLAQTSWQGADVRDVVERIVEPYGREHVDRFSISGPDVMLPVQIAPPLSMVVHELAANAVKYGALSVADGRVSVRWAVESNGGPVLNPPKLRISWQEHDGPAVREPSRRGFGTEMIEQVISYQLHGHSTLTFDRSGVRCEIWVPFGDPPVPSGADPPEARGGESGGPAS